MTQCLALGNLVSNSSHRHSEAQPDALSHPPVGRWGNTASFIVKRNRRRSPSLDWGFGMSNGREALQRGGCMQAEKEEMRNQLKGYAEDGESDICSDGEDSSTLTPNTKLKKKKKRHATV